MSIYRVKPFENIKGIGENAGEQYFLLYPQFFHPSQNKFLFSEKYLTTFC